jgi:hypothetical protein
MNQRILAVSAYLFRSFLFSLAGLLYILLALAYYMVLFDPRQLTPDPDYYILVLGLLGLGLSFLVTLSIAARANNASHFPLIVRLPSRIEYLTAVFFSSILFASIIQFVIALIALVANGPNLDFREYLLIPPFWISGNVLFAVLSLHATDLVTAGWSRVYVFATIGLLLYLQSGLDVLSDWLSNLFNQFGNTLLATGLDALATLAFDMANLFSEGSSSALGSALSLVFWPFKAIVEAAINGHFTPLQALAPAFLMTYAALLFVLAAKFFSKKDLFLSE